MLARPRMIGARDHIPIKSASSEHPLNYAALILGHYDCRVYFGSACVDIDRGSLLCAKAVRIVNDQASGLVGRIGQFCDFAESLILWGGEHRNELPVNVVFSSVAVMRLRARQEAPQAFTVREEQPFSVGNAVVVGNGARLLGGVEIGDGAVIGSGAVVTGDVEPFSVQAGVPARKLKDRFDSQTRQAICKTAWWTFSTPYLLNNLADLQSLSTADGPHEHRGETPRFILEISGSPERMRVEVRGFVCQGQEHGFDVMPERVRGYVQQLGSSIGYWVPDIWAD